MLGNLESMANKMHDAIVIVDSSVGLDNQCELNKKVGKGMLWPLGDASLYFFLLYI